jgi:hypothetical protein
MKKYIPRLVIIFFLIVLVIFISILFRSCFDVTEGKLDKDKIENGLKGVN